MNESLRVSVVVPTCGRPELLQRCLQALARQSLPAEMYEVIVVDDGGTTRASSLPASSPLRLRHAGTAAVRSGPAAARNVGWKLAQAGLIAFTDDDTIPDRDWLQRGLAAFTDPAVDAASGRTVVPLPPEPTDWERNTAGLERAEFVTANCFVRKAALEQIGGFDERFKLPWREDSDLHFALLRRGFNVVRVNEAVVVHPVRAAPFGASLRTQRNVCFDALLYRKHRALYRARIRPRPPLGYYTAVTALLLGAGGLLLDARAAAIGGLSCWALWTVAFTAQRLRHTSRSPSHVLEMIVTSAAIPLLAVFWRVAGAVRFRVWFA